MGASARKGIDHGPWAMARPGTPRLTLNFFCFDFRLSIHSDPSTFYSTQVLGARGSLDAQIAQISGMIQITPSPSQAPLPALQPSSIPGPDYGLQSLLKSEDAHGLPVSGWPMGCQWRAARQRALAA